MAKRPLNLGGAAPARAGHAFENKTRGELERAGWYVVATPPANDRGIDLIATKRVGLSGLCFVLAVQCKRNGYMAPAERESLFKLSAAGLVPVLAGSNGAGGVIFLELLNPFAAPAVGYQRFTPLDARWRIECPNI